MASTLLHEQGWNHQAIERQLAYAERNAGSAAYNFAEDLPQRRSAANRQAMGATLGATHSLESTFQT
jgi:hypothetical protein